MYFAMTRRGKWRPVVNLLWIEADGLAWIRGTGKDRDKWKIQGTAYLYHSGMTDKIYMSYDGYWKTRL